MPRLNLPAFVVPAAPRLVAAPPVGPQWLHEPKLDGWRCELAKAGATIALYSRNGIDLSPRARDFAARIAAAIPELRVLLDGELVALGPDGRADFHALPHALSSGSALMRYFAFDILARGGHDLRRLPLEERRAQLASFLGGCDASLLASFAVMPDGVRLLSECERFGFEGVVSKRRDLPYRSGRRSDWLKVKCEAWRALHGDRGKSS